MSILQTLKKAEQAENSLQQLSSASPLAAPAPTPLQVVPPAVPPQPTPPVTMRDFGDSTAVRTAIYDRVLGAARNLKPVSNTRYQLHVQDVDYEDPAEYPISRQKEAILKGETLARRLRGTWVLRDATGQEIERKRTTLATVPYFTPRGTFIIGGTENTLKHQMRLRAGVFARRKENGELEAHANILPGKGMSHRYNLEPETGVFKAQFAQANLPLYSVLRHVFGVPDTRLRESWGNELFESNAKKDDPRVLDKLYERLVRRTKPDATPEDKAKAVREALEKMEFDPEVNKRTLGSEHRHVGPDMILAATNKLLAINRGEVEADDRDHLAYQHFMGPEDLLAERLERPGSLLNQLLWKASTKGTLNSLPVNALNRHLHAAILDSGLGMPLEEVNPLDVFDQQTAVSRLGVGGIPCFSEDTEVLTSEGWLPWPDVKWNTKLACQLKGKLVFREPLKLHSAHYEGEMCEYSDIRLRYKVTPDHRMWVAERDSTDFDFKLAGEVHGKYLRFCTGGAVYEGGTPPPETYVVGERVYPMSDWLQLLCHYLHGSTNKVVDNEVHISAGDRSPLEGILQRMGLEYEKTQSYRYLLTSLFIVKDAALACHLQQFGKADERFLPDYLLQADPDTRRACLDIWRQPLSRFGKQLLSARSETLREGLGWLAVSLGYSIIGCNSQNLLIHEKSFCGPDPAQRNASHDYRRTPYNGMVYCATVPGGLVLTRYRGTTLWSGNSLDAIPDEARNVHPSQVGYIDLLRTPESLRVGVDARITYAARKGSDGRVYAPYTDAKTGQTVYKSPQDVADSVMAFPGEMEKGDKYVKALEGGKASYVPRESVEYILPHPERWFSPITNLVPQKPTIKGQRVAMGSRFSTQALPVENPEAPLVRGQVPGMVGKSFEEHYGRHMGAVFAKDQPGRVESVDQDSITVRYEDGSVDKQELYNHLPYNRKTYLHNTPLVQPGDPVRPGQLLAKSNYTDDKGHVAVGLNLRVAEIPFAGSNYEDAWVISESAAKKLSSGHMYQHDFEFDQNLRRGKKNFTAIFPAKFEKKLLDTMDDDGVIKEGTKVRPGDPLILAAVERPVTAKSIHAGHKGSFADRSVLWEHHNEGVVTDVAKTSKGVVVAVSSVNPSQVGDKLCYDEQTEILTSEGWKPVAQVTVNDRVATLLDGARFKYLRPEAVHAFQHTGRMYSLQTTQVDLLVTDNHKLYARPRNHDDYGLYEARELYGKRYNLKRNAEWQAGTDPEFVTLPGPIVKAGQGGRVTKNLDDMRVPVRTYITLLGMFLSEGNCFKDEKSGSYGFDITQVKPDTRAELLDELQRLNVKFNSHSNDTKVRVYSKHWYEHFKQFGYSGDKFIPAEVFSWSSELQRLLYKWLMWGDGCVKGSCHTYTTTSPRLADDVQRLALHIGMSANVKHEVVGQRFLKGKMRECADCYNVYIYRSKNEPTINHGHAKRQNGQHEAWVEFSGQVYCVTMPVGHVIYVRRGGKPVWCGNSNRYGGKGVIAKIVPDEDMPHGPDGQPYELLANPGGIISRGNPGAKLEYWLGKIAAKTGKPVVMEDFANTQDATEHVMNLLRQHGLEGMEDVADPHTGRKMKVATGMQYFMKLVHTAEGKHHGRGLGAYTAEDTPAKGGTEGSKRLALMDVNALLSHGALGVLRDARLVRGQKNQEYWSTYMSGYRPATPPVPLVYRKFIDQLRGGGVNVERRGSQLHLMALTDKHIDHLAANRAIENVETVDWKNDDMKPIKGGLFDTTTTGGHGGNKWSFIKLHEPMPNPVMEEPIRHLLGLTGKGLQDVIAGREKLEGKTGTEAIHAALSKINVKAALQTVREQVKSSRKGVRDEAVRKLGYLKACEDNGTHPKDWILTKVPVLPPMFRPVSRMQGGTSLISDANYLYKEVWDANETLKELKDKVDDVSEERETLYKAFKAVTGLGDPVQPKNQERQVKGMLAQVFGDSPKFGTVQQKLLGTTVDLVGRAVVAPNPDLSMDEVGLPENRAWEVYAPFIMRRLVRSGMNRVVALQAVKDRSQHARKALLAELDERPVLVNRAPVLHRYGMMAFYPRLVKGDVLQVSPLVVAGFGMDFDGDTSNYQVVADDEAAREALHKMLPSRNLVSVSDMKKPMYTPRQEYVGGLHSATASVKKDKRPRTFATVADALRAYENHELDPDDPIEVLEENGSKRS